MSPFSGAQTCCRQQSELGLLYSNIKGEGGGLGERLKWPGKDLETDQPVTSCFEQWSVGSYTQILQGPATRQG